MKKLIFRLFIILIITLVLTLNSTLVKTEQALEFKTPQPNQTLEAKKLDPKAKVLEEYLSKHNSPLKDHAQDFIEAANQYELDWRLVAAISGVESTFGKFIPGGYNGWGWGVYGTQAIYFKSWRDGIFTVSQGLRENYINRGYTEPYAMNRIYAASPFWGGKVTFFMKDLDKFAQNYQAEDIAQTVAQPSDKVAASSALAI